MKYLAKQHRNNHPTQKEINFQLVRGKPKKQEGDKQNQEDNAMSKQRWVPSNKLCYPSHGDRYNQRYTITSIFLKVAKGEVNLIGCNQIFLLI